MESAMNLENAPQSSAADLSNFLTKERLTAALRDVAQLKINEAMYLSRLSALEYKLQSSPATPSTVQMTPSPSSRSVSSPTPARSQGSVVNVSDVASALSGSQPHTVGSALVELKIEPAGAAHKGETNLRTEAPVFSPKPVMVNKCFQTPERLPNASRLPAYDRRRHCELQTEDTRQEASNEKHDM